MEKSLYSEFKYFKIETSMGGTIILANNNTYDDNINELLEPYFITESEFNKINEYLGGILPLKNVVSFNLNDDSVELIEKLHKAIYHVLGNDIKQFVISVYGNPEMMVGL
jgi:hypothetical protein